MIDDHREGESVIGNLIAIPEAVVKTFADADLDPPHHAAAVTTGLVTMLFLGGWKPLAPKKLKFIPAPPARRRGEHPGGPGAARAHRRPHHHAVHPRHLRRGGRDRQPARLARVNPRRVRGRGRVQAPPPPGRPFGHRRRSGRAGFVVRPEQAGEGCPLVAGQAGRQLHQQGQDG